MSPTWRGPTPTPRGNKAKREALGGDYEPVEVMTLKAMLLRRNRLIASLEKAVSK